MTIHDDTVRPSVVAFQGRTPPKPDPGSNQFAGTNNVNGQSVTVFWHDVLVPGWWWRPAANRNKAFGPFVTSRGALLDAIRSTTGA